VFVAVLLAFRNLHNCIAMEAPEYLTSLVASLSCLDRPTASTCVDTASTLAADISSAFSGLESHPGPRQHGGYRHGRRTLDAGLEISILTGPGSSRLVPQSVSHPIYNTDKAN